MSRGVSIDEVRRFWDRRPCNIRHSPLPVGSREYFDEVEARRYFVEPHNVRFAEFPRWQGKKVLEIGCGIGTDTINFARHGARVTAIDLSPKSLEIASRRAEVYELQDRIRFYQADVEELERSVPVEPYDLVYGFGVVHHTPNPRRALEQIRLYLRDEGVLKLMVYHRYSWKVLQLLWRHGGCRFWRIPEIVSQYSEAETGCPVSYTFSRGEIRRLLERCGFRVTAIDVEHIFLYRISNYVQYRHVQEWYFRWMPSAIFSWMKHRFGWHLCVTAQAQTGHTP